MGAKSRVKLPVVILASAAFAGALGGVLIAGGYRVNDVLNIYLGPGLLIGYFVDLFLRAFCKLNAGMLGGPAEQIIPVTVISVMTWSAPIAATLYSASSRKLAARLLLATLNTHVFVFFALAQFSQLPILASPKVARTLTVGDVVLFMMPLLFSLLVFLFCIPVFTRRITFWSLLTSFVLILPSLIRCVQMDNLPVISVISILTMPVLAYRIYRNSQTDDLPEKAPNDSVD